MKAIAKAFLLTAVLTLVWGCSSDDGNSNNSGTGVVPPVPNYTFTASEKPAWAVDWTWTDAQPAWQDPGDEVYESRMTVTLRLAKEYIPYSTDDDRMAIFSGDECRGVSLRNVIEHATTGSNDIYFSVYVHGDGSESAMLYAKYYCAGMKQTFTTNLGTNFSPDEIIGGTEDVEFGFGVDGTKYTSGGGKATVTGNMPFTPSDNDVVGVFVGDECRGTGKPGEYVYVWSRQATETCQLRYYSAQKQGVYTMNQTVTINLRNIDLTFNFQ